MTQPNQNKLIESVLSILGIVDRTSGNRPEQIATLEQEITAHTNAEIAKRELLLLDELEDAVGNAKYGEDQGFNYEQAVDDVYDFINAKRGKK